MYRERQSCSQVLVSSESFELWFALAGGGAMAHADSYCSVMVWVCQQTLELPGQLGYERYVGDESPERGWRRPHRFGECGLFDCGR